jgi:hypothetical protein
VTRYTPTPWEIAVNVGTEEIAAALQIKAEAFYAGARDQCEFPFYEGGIHDQHWAARYSLADRVLRGVEL